MGGYVHPLIKNAADKKGRKIKFNFRIITCGDGTDVIDTTLKTPCSSLTPSQMEDYIEMDNNLTYMERVKEEERKKAEREQKIVKNPLYRMACALGFA